MGGAVLLSRRSRLTAGCGSGADGSISTEKGWHTHVLSVAFKCCQPGNPLSTVDNPQ